MLRLHRTAAVANRPQPASLPHITPAIPLLCRAPGSSVQRKGCATQEWGSAWFLFCGPRPCVYDTLGTGGLPICYSPLPNYSSDARRPLNGSLNSATFVLAPLRTPLVAVASRAVTAIKPVSRATAPIFGLRTKRTARPSPSRCQVPPLSIRPSAKWRSFGSSRNSVASLSKPMPRSVTCGRPRRSRRPTRKKNGRSHPEGSCARSRPTFARGLQRPPQDGALGTGSPGDGHACGHASSRGSRADRTVAIPSPGCRPAEHALRLRPSGALPGVALQAGPHGGRPSGSLAALLPVPGLPYRTVPRRCRTGYRAHGVLSCGAPHVGSGRPGGAFRSRAPADQTARRPGGDYPECGAHRGGDWAGHRRGRAGRDPAGQATGSANRAGKADTYSVCGNRRDGDTGGEERNGGPSG